jgi:hypothetical protein
LLPRFVGRIEQLGLSCIVPRPAGAGQSGSGRLKPVVSQKYLLHEKLQLEIFRIETGEKACWFIVRVKYAKA